jgi:dTDP-4-amino-4,6-dideoxygalactose transaminase
LSAFLWAQLEAIEKIQATRKRIFDTYNERLAAWANANNVRLPHVPEHCEQSYHMFYMILPSLEARQGLIAHLKQQGILAVYHYLPLHTSDMGIKYGGKLGDCPVTEHVSDRLLRLPFFNDLTDELQAQVIEAVLQYSVS